MYKGAQKRVIVLKNTGSELFDEAHFIVKDDVRESAEMCDMMEEANRILGECLLSGYFQKPEKMTPSNSKGLAPALWFTLGVLTCAVGVVLAVVIS